MAYLYTGGAHGNTGYEEFNFAIVHGKPQMITLDELFGTSPQVARELSTQLISHLRSDPNAEWIQNGSITDFDPKQLAYVVGDEALTFIFPPYAVGPYAAGAFYVKLPYKDILLPLNRSIPIGQK